MRIGAFDGDPLLVTNLRWITTKLWPALVAAWWAAWDELWLSIGEDLDPRYQRDEKSRERNDHTGIEDLGGGNFWGAGCGSDGE